MTRIFKDIAKKGSSQLTLADGWSATRVFEASEVEGNPDAIMYEAIRNGEVPKPGELHPTIPLIVVVDVTANSVGSNQVEINVNYRALKSGETSVDEEAQTSLTIGGAIQTVKTNEQIKIVGGKEVTSLIVVEYTYPEGKVPDGGPRTKKIVATVDKQIPVITATLSRLESEDPAQKAFDFVGRLNSKTFIGGEPGDWQCMAIGGPSNDSGETWNVTYQFMRAQDGWNTTVAFTDENGKIPTDIVDDKGKVLQPKALIKAVTQPRADFTLLNLGPFVKGKKIVKFGF